MVLGGGRLKCDCCCTLRDTYVYVWVPAAADWQGAHETETVEEGEVALRLLSRRGRGASLLRRFVDVVCAVWLCVCLARVLGCGEWDISFV